MNYSLELSKQWLSIYYFKPREQYNIFPSAAKYSRDPLYLCICKLH